MGRWGTSPSQTRQAVSAIPCDTGNSTTSNSASSSAVEPPESTPSTVVETTCANRRCPPEALREASTEAAPPGYLVHKGCLFPDQTPQSEVVNYVDDSFTGVRSVRWRRQEVQIDHVEENACTEEKKCSHRGKQRRDRRSRIRAERWCDKNKLNDKDRTAIVWLRDDLRLDDNPALNAASRFGSLICVFLHDEEDPSPWPLRGAALWWKFESLRCFSASVRDIGGSLVLCAGSPLDILCHLCFEVNAEVVLWNRLCEPWYHKRDLQVEEGLRLNGLEVRSFKAAALWEPWEAKPDERSYNRGFGSVGFYRSAVAELGDVEEPLAPVTRLPPLSSALYDKLAPANLALAQLGYHLTAGRGFPCDFRNYNQKRQRRASDHTGVLPPDDNWASEFASFWNVGEKAALRRLKEFLDQVLGAGLYEQRDRFRADRKWTAVLSPYIRFGELSVRRCYYEALAYGNHKVHTEKGWRPANSTFARRFFWRDLAYWSLWRFPDLPQCSLRKHYETEKWSGTKKQLKLWQRGRTGFPLVDAAMRQLWQVGWMPNYLRHICAQFLVEYLDISWKQGFEWFDYTLIDSDVAINAFMWQNGGHSGLDQWNFVMHPVFAAKSCDPEGHYVRCWLPELSGLPLEYIHCPWKAPARLLLGANILFGRTYFQRTLEDLDQARKQHAKEVLRVRHDHPELIAKGGNEWFEVRAGYWVTLITRDDFRWDTDVFVTRQTADDPRNAKKRQLQDSLSLVMGDFIKQHDRMLLHEQDVL